MKKKISHTLRLNFLVWEWMHESHLKSKCLFQNVYSASFLGLFTLFFPMKYFACLVTHKSFCCQGKKGSLNSYAQSMKSISLPIFFNFCHIIDTYHGIGGFSFRVKCKIICCASKLKDKYLLTENWMYVHEIKSDQLPFSRHSHIIVRYI